MWNVGRIGGSVGAVVVAALLAMAPAADAQAPGAGDPTVAPATTASSDGRSVTDGARTLTASAVARLAPDGQTVTVSGSGYDTNKGIYVALCLIPAPNQVPTPCGGGADQSGTGGGSHWISSHPPAYGDGLASPYGPGGSFSVSVAVRAALGNGIDCRHVRCALVTRNDHTRGGDRSQDLLLPVSFAAEGAAPPPPPAATTVPPVPAPSVPATTAPLPAAAPAELSADGTVASDGTRTLEVSAVADLDPDGAEVEVVGGGYAAGVYVALCVRPAAGQAPGPCLGGSAGSSAWVSSDPPDYAAGRAVPYEDGGRFAVTLRLTPVIDGDHDCRKVACGVATRNDHTRGDDRSQDLFVPISFDGGTTSAAAATGAGAGADDESSGGAGTAVAIVVALAVLVAVGVSVPYGVRRRERKLARPA